MPIKKRCLYCHKIFKVKPKRKDTAKFCSILCKNNYALVELECCQCSKIFKRTKGIMKARKAQKIFCSIECRLKYNNKNGAWNKGINLIESTCDFCGEQILRPLSKYKLSKFHFCSKNCYDKWKIKNMMGNKNPNWQGGHLHYRGETWFNQRKKALERDDYLCQKCGIRNVSLDVHHIIPFNEFDDFELANQLDNLITVCEPCHGAFEFESRMLVKNLIKKK